VVDAAIGRNVDAAESVGAIMHGATWKACPSCAGGGKHGRRKCPACHGSGEDQTFAERDIKPIRSAAFTSLGL
jgi:DnaJ-class molecular chaperone